MTDSLIRLSTGLEDTGDLLEDLRQALDKLQENKQLRVELGFPVGHSGDILEKKSYINN